MHRKEEFTKKKQNEAADTETKPNKTQAKLSRIIN